MTSNDTAFTGDSVPAAGEIKFDEKSGISLEEQKEILAGINGIAEKNRRSLSGVSTARSFKAKKNGGLFPIVVNVAAALILAGGFFLMYFFHSREEIQIREGTKVFNTAERALIEEIRKETSLRIEEKENEISLIVSKMEDIDSQLRNLYSSNMELTAEQIAAEESLKQLQEEYGVTLATLRDDRSRILESARAREASLYAQLEEQAREINEISETSEAALNRARAEMQRLNSEYEKAAALDAQLRAGFQVTGEQINGGNFADATNTLETLRQFLNTSDFQGLRSIQARKEIYIQTITVLESMIEEAVADKEALAAVGAGDISVQEVEELRAENTRLSENVDSLNRTLATANSQGSDTARRLTELENSAAALRTRNNALETRAQQRDADIAAKDETIAGLESQNTELTQTITAKDETIRTLEEDKTSLDTQLTSLRQALQALSQ